MIYYTNRICKDGNPDLEKGDIGFKGNIELTDVVSAYRVLLKDIVGWEEYKQSPEYPLFQNTEPKVRLSCMYGPNIVIIAYIKEFDEVMKDFIEKQSIYKNN